MCVPEVLINESGDGIIVKKKIDGEDYEIEIFPKRYDGLLEWFAESKGYILAQESTIHEAIESAVNNIKSR
jgi:hypothetical protein